MVNVPPGNMRTSPDNSILPDHDTLLVMSPVALVPQVSVAEGIFFNQFCADQPVTQSLHWIFQNA